MRTWRNILPYCSFADIRYFCDVIRDVFNERVSNDDKILIFAQRVNGGRDVQQW